MIRRCLAAAALLLCAPASAQTQPAPEAVLASFRVGPFGGPAFWVSPDLALLGRIAGQEASSPLWFWSRARGAFPVALPVDVAPDRDSFCSHKGAVQWLGVALGRRGSSIERQVVRLIVDPVTGDSRIEANHTELVFQVLNGSAPITLVATERAGPGGFYVTGGDCPFIPVDAAIEKIRALNLPDNDYTTLWPLAGGGFLASWQPRGDRTAPSRHRVLAADLSLVEPQPENPLRHDPAMEKMKAIGELSVVDLAEAPAPFRMQVQLKRPDGRVLGLMTAAEGELAWLSPSLDGCTLWVRTRPMARTAMVVRPAPPPSARPAVPLGLGPPVMTETATIFDLCSPETTRALDAALAPTAQQ